MKICKSCGIEKEQSEYYANACLCRPCYCKRVKKNRSDRREQYAEYERNRNKTEARKAKKIQYQRKKRALNPQKAKAWVLVRRAVRNGTLVKGPCGVCGSKVMVEAHHDDYRKPLEVKWRCFKHHREVEHGQTVSFVPVATPTKRNCNA